jgi:hypothetical protein
MTRPPTDDAGRRERRVRYWGALYRRLFGEGTAEETEDR